MTIRHNYADISSIGQALGFSPKVALEEGIERFVRWAKTQPIAEDGAEDGLDRANRELIERGLMKVSPDAEVPALWRSRTSVGIGGQPGA